MMRIYLLAALAVGLIFLGAAQANDATKAPSPAEKITATAQQHRYAIEFDGTTFSGPGYEKLLREARDAQFFLIGEEHGIAENPKLAAQLFAALVTSGYSKLAIEISPPMASILDKQLLEGGIDALRQLYRKPGGEPAFFGMTEEANMLASVRNSVPAEQQAFWGTDYEVAGDRTLLRALQRLDKPPAAEAALDALIAASESAWAKYEATGGPQYIFSFAGDPALVSAVEAAWPQRGTEAASILRTLRETLEINRLWVAGSSFASNQRRAALLRENFLQHWRRAQGQGAMPKVMAKFGANHIVRGRNMTNTFDLGTLLPELAALDEGRSFAIMVVPGAGSPIAKLNPSTWSYEAALPEHSYSSDILPITAAAYEDTFTLIDLVPLRARLGSSPKSIDDALLRVIYGYDMLLVMSKSTAASEFEH